MVILSAAIVTSSKTLVARQFVEMTRLRIESLLSVFQKLVNTGRDHTFIETESVRYVYQPMESLHLLVVTNKSSNILEDLETMRMLANVVAGCCTLQVNEELVKKNALDIVFAFDEVISLGQRDGVTLSQIKSYIEMDSQEERIHQMIEQSKINAARETAKKKQRELKDLKIPTAKANKEMVCIGSDNDTQRSNTLGPIQNTMDVTEETLVWTHSQLEPSTKVIKAQGGSKPGMKLSQKKFGDGLLGLSELLASHEPEVAAEPVAVAPVNGVLGSVTVEIEETISAELKIDGSMENDARCSGQFQVTVHDTTKADLVCFKLNPQSSEFKYKVHPNLNKQSYANNVLEVYDASRAFHANASATLLKWQTKSFDEHFLPVALSCWPESKTDCTQMVVEVQLQDTSMCIEDVHIRFPAALGSKPFISSVEPGEAKYDPSEEQVHWQIPLLDHDMSIGTLEFRAHADPASLFPGEFEATRRDHTRCPMEILECYHQARKDAITFTCIKSSLYSFKINA